MLAETKLATDNWSDKKSPNNGPFWHISMNSQILTKNITTGEHM